MDELAKQFLHLIRLTADPRGITSAFCQTLDKNLPTHLLAVGKAAIPMTHAAQTQLTEKFDSSLVISTPPPKAIRFSTDTEFHIADHPLATERNLHAAQRTLKFVRSLPQGARLLVLLSGGGSALLTLPAPPLTLVDIRTVTDALIRAGCNIHELNTVRKHIEQLKGGRLAQHSSAGDVLVVAVSDVVGDDLSIIASGPFAPDTSTFSDALDVLRDHGCLNASDAVTRFLEQGAAGKHEETPKPGDSAFDSITPLVILFNGAAVNAAEDVLESHNYSPCTETDSTAEASELGAHAANLLSEHDSVVIGGEPVVTGIKPGSSGGPMQEAALAAALALENRDHDWLVFAFATDGVDGPTSAAGAVINPADLQQARTESLPLEVALAEHNSHTILAQMNCLIETGPTGTNINDILVVVRR
ncbi:MAG: glycerate kinase [Phycisphaerales bacterium]